MQLQCVMPVSFYEPLYAATTCCRHLFYVLHLQSFWPTLFTKLYIGNRNFWIFVFLYFWNFTISRFCKFSIRIANQRNKQTHSEWVNIVCLGVSEFISFMRLYVYLAVSVYSFGCCWCFAVCCGLQAFLQLYCLWFLL